MSAKKKIKRKKNKQVWRYFVHFSLKKELYSRRVASILIGLHALSRNQSLKGKFGRLCFLGTLVSLRDRLRGAVLAAMRATKRENDVKAGCGAGWRADRTGFGDRTGAIFPACFLAGWAGEPVRSKKNVTWFSRAGIVKNRWTQIWHQILYL